MVGKILQHIIILTNRDLMNFRQQISQQSSTERWHVHEQKKTGEGKSMGASIYLHSPQNHHPSIEAYHPNHPIPDFQLQHIRFKPDSELARNKLGRSAVSKPTVLQEPRDHRIHAVNRTTSPNQNMHFTQTNNYNFYYQNAPKKTQPNVHHISTPKGGQENRHAKASKFSTVNGINNEQIFNYFDGVKEQFKKIEQLKLKNAQNEEAYRKMQESLVATERKSLEQQEAARRLANEIESIRTSTKDEISILKKTLENKEKQLSELKISKKEILIECEKIKQENTISQDNYNFLQLKNKQLTNQLEKKQLFLEEQEESIKMIDKLRAQVSGMEREWVEKTVDLEKNVEELQALVEQLEKEKYQQIVESEQQLTVIKQGMKRELQARAFQWEEGLKQTKKQYEQHFQLLTESLRHKDLSLSKLAGDHALLNKQYATLKHEKTNQRNQEVNNLNKKIQNLQTELKNKTNMTDQLMVMMKNNQKEAGIKYKKDLEDTVIKYESKIKQITEACRQKDEKKETISSSHQKVIQLMKEEWLEEKLSIQQKSKQEVFLLERELESTKQNLHSDKTEREQLKHELHSLMQMYSQEKKRNYIVISKLQEDEENLTRSLRSLENKLQYFMESSLADEQKFINLKEQIEIKGNPDFFISVVEEMGGENEMLRKENNKLRGILFVNKIETQVPVINEGICFKFLRESFDQLALSTHKAMEVEAHRLDTLLSFQQSRLSSLLDLLSSFSNINLPRRSQNELQDQQLKGIQRKNRIYSTNTLPTRADSLSFELECRDGTIKQLTSLISEYKMMISEMKDRIEKGEQIRRQYEQILDIFGVKGEQHEKLLERIQSFTSQQEQSLKLEIKELISMVSSLQEQNLSIRSQVQKQQEKMQQLTQLLSEANETVLVQQLKTKNLNYQQ